MALLDFPSNPSPSVGDTYTENNVTYEYTSAGIWSTGTTSGGGGIFSTLYEYRGNFTSSDPNATRSNVTHPHNLNIVGNYTLPVWAGLEGASFGWSYDGGSQWAGYSTTAYPNIRIFNLSYGANTMSCTIQNACPVLGAMDQPVYTPSGTIQILY